MINRAFENVFVMIAGIVVKLLMNWNDDPLDIDWDDREET